MVKLFIQSITDLFGLTGSKYPPLLLITLTSIAVSSCGSNNKETEALLSGRWEYNKVEVSEFGGTDKYVRYIIFFPENNTFLSGYSNYYKRWDGNTMDGVEYEGTYKVSGRDIKLQIDYKTIAITDNFETYSFEEDGGITGGDLDYRTMALRDIEDSDYQEVLYLEGEVTDSITVKGFLTTAGLVYPGNEEPEPLVFYKDQW